MRTRGARISDAAAICELVNYYAERGRMLHRSLESIYETLRNFSVAEDGDGLVVGCVAVDICWGPLAEVRSLAVLAETRGRGVGDELMRAAIEDARQIGVDRLFALTYEKDFFLRYGFEVIDRHCLPEKVWRACINCSKVDACDEIAVMLQFDGR